MLPEEIVTDGGTCATGKTTLLPAFTLTVGAVASVTIVDVVTARSSVTEPDVANPPAIGVPTETFAQDSRLGARCYREPRGHVRPSIGAI